VGVVMKNEKGNRSAGVHGKCKPTTGRVAGHDILAMDGKIIVFRCILQVSEWRLRLTVLNISGWVKPPIIHYLRAK